MSITTLREVADEFLFSKYLTIMADEMTDKSNRELVLRHIDSELQLQKEFIVLNKILTLDAVALTQTIQNCTLRMSLSIQNCRGQYYNGASDMSGA